MKKETPPVNATASESYGGRGNSSGKSGKTIVTDIESDNEPAHQQEVSQGMPGYEEPTSNEEITFEEESSEETVVFEEPSQEEPVYEEPSQEELVYEEPSQEENVYEEPSENRTVYEQKKEEVTQDVESIKTNEEEIESDFFDSSQHHNGDL